MIWQPIMKYSLILRCPYFLIQTEVATEGFKCEKIKVIGICVTVFQRGMFVILVCFWVKLINYQRIRPKWELTKGNITNLNIPGHTCPLYNSETPNKYITLEFVKYWIELISDWVWLYFVNSPLFFASIFILLLSRHKFSFPFHT